MRRPWPIGFKTPTNRHPGLREVHLSTSQSRSSISCRKSVQNLDNVFTTNERRPVSGFSKAKTRFDKAMIELLRAELKADGENPDKAELEDWIFHDLRRTAATITPQDAKGWFRHCGYSTSN